MYFVLDGNEKVVLAEQMMLDCGSGSCQGGSLTGAFKTIIDKEGAALEEDYPYRASDGKICLFISVWLGWVSLRVVFCKVLITLLYLFLFL